jgi:hypothetical protein
MIHDGDKNFIDNRIKIVIASTTNVKFEKKKILIVR